jgi:ribosomal protein S18 acetylase RimI-like enzyme
VVRGRLRHRHRPGRRARRGGRQDDAQAVGRAAVTARPATAADVDGIVALQARWDSAWFGGPDRDEDEVRADLRRADPLAERSLLLHDGEHLVAAAWWWRSDDPTLLVDPALGGGGVAATGQLVSWLASSGAEQVEALSRDSVLLDVLAQQGWVHVRSQFELLRPAEGLPTASWPPGVTVSGLGDDATEVHRLVYLDAGWGDVPGHTVRSLDEWLDLFVTDVDPAQQVLCRQGGRLLGVALGKVFTDGTGWVAQLAVRRDAQGRGLGRALLAEAFGRRVAAGATQLGLGVSATNAAALRLYESLGLTVDREWMVHRLRTTTDR